jgi:hypothetical protein
MTGCPTFTWGPTSRPDGRLDRGGLGVGAAWRPIHQATAAGADPSLLGGGGTQGMERLEDRRLLLQN